MATIRVGLIGFDQVNALDLVGPAEAFTNALIDGTDGNAKSGYEICVIGLTCRPFVAESGMVFRPHTTLSAATALDTIIIPGGRGLRERQINHVIAEWIKNERVE